MAAQVNALELTRKLLSFNTINPPGQERQCAQYLGKLLEDGGFKVAYYDFAESRTSLIARLEGRRDNPPICFTSCSSAMLQTAFPHRRRIAAGLARLRPDLRSLPKQ